MGDISQVNVCAAVFFELEWVCGIELSDKGSGTCGLCEWVYYWGIRIREETVFDDVSMSLKNVYT